MTIPVTATKGEADVLLNAAIDELKTQFGVGHPDDLADSQMYYLPQGVIGNAFAKVGTGISVYGDMWYVYFLIVHQVISFLLFDPCLERVPLQFLLGKGA